jgi:steroid delta-isomerase-like uncharacterized protein
VDASSPVRRWYAAWNTKDMSVADQTVGPDVVVHGENQPDIVGIDAYKQLVTAFWAAFEPLTLTVEQVITEGDRVLMRSHFAATFAGGFMGLAPTGKQVAWRFHNIYRVEGGRWVEAWTMPDSLSMMRQLGAIPGT